MKKNLLTAEAERLQQLYHQERPWHTWGPYLSERQWGTVREDYSAEGQAWDYFPHDHARSRVYRWGEDGLAGISDDQQRLCFAPALWNGRDPILKERLFGLAGPEGNHGEDVKELYYYLDNLPSHAYMKHLYKYPHAEFPYTDLTETNRQASKLSPEYELLDTGVFEDQKYFDVFTEYAKSSEEDILIRITIYNRGGETAPVWVLPTLWFRNLWSFGLTTEKPDISQGGRHEHLSWVNASHSGLGAYQLYFQTTQQVLFTDNETNTERLYGQPNESPYVKDAFHKAVIAGTSEPFASRGEGSKFAPVYHFELPGHGKTEIRLRLCKAGKVSPSMEPLGSTFEAIFDQRIGEADAFYSTFAGGMEKDTANIQRQAFAGMLWSKQYFNLDIPRWLHGDPGQPAPPAQRLKGRNHEWAHLNNEDIISMPDKWEYPWYAAWDLAFHCVPLAMLDAGFAKNQLILFLREWYMHPNGQLPAYEWALGDVNPPVHAWACLQVYQIDKKQNGKADTVFLKRVFQKLLLNFTWWVNRKDRKGNNVFDGGFLGLDNIGLFDRSSYIPGGGYLEQADGTAWMGMYCLNMLEMSLILAEEDIAYEDMATKFFEHFVYIAASLNRMGEDWTSAWDEEEGFFYDVLAMPDGRYIPLKIRSLVGLSTLFATLVLKKEKLEKLPGFYNRLKWFQTYRMETQEYLAIETQGTEQDILLSLVPEARLRRLLTALLSESEFLGKGGIRAISKIHETPCMVEVDGQSFGLQYEPGESSTSLFGGNSNWRGPIWMPMNYLLIQSLKSYHQYYGDSLRIAYPTGAEQQLSLAQIAQQLSQRLVSIFQKDENGQRPVHGSQSEYHTDPHFRDLILFYEYFHGDHARGVGASHQTGWTGLVAELIESLSENPLSASDK